ncbi:MAG: nuclear transport factor 2 family protein [Candidatus Dormibacteraeota bacterium]|nr:nuclear transport factor 2 family protein [Candidatus Dormibacteraeota bacterium]
MGGPLEQATRQLFDCIDRKDGEAIISAGAKDMQAVDEISRRWMRGIDDFAAYVRQLMKMVEDVHTTLSDVHETVRGDIGLAACWIEQDYTLEGKPQHVSAPTTLAFQRESSAWKILLLHTVPLPPEES